jgi:hypothetical protein
MLKVNGCRNKRGSTIKHVAHLAKIQAAVNAGAGITTPEVYVATTLGALVGRIASPKQRETDAQTRLSKKINSRELAHQHPNLSMVFLYGHVRGVMLKLVFIAKLRLE